MGLDARASDQKSLAALRALIASIYQRWMAGSDVDRGDAFLSYRRVHRTDRKNGEGINVIDAPNKEPIRSSHEDGILSELGISEGSFKVNEQAWSYNTRDSLCNFCEVRVRRSVPTAELI